jgi:AcrR family transcriptional regulator
MAQPAMSVPGLRERTRRAAKSEIAETAMRLFLDQGFDATTVDQIASEVGISRRSLFRYFATKEDIVFGNLAELGLTIKSALEACPDDMPPWEALRTAFASLVCDPEYSLERTLKLSRMLHDTPSLRAGLAEKHLQWQELLAPNIEMRLGASTSGGTDPRAQAIVACAMGCLEAAKDAWTRTNGEREIQQIYDEIVASVRAG